MTRLWKNRLNRLLCAGLLLGGLLPGQALGLNAGLDLGLFDCARTQTAVSPEIVLVTLDEVSFDKVGAFPWKRDVYADLITTLNQSGAKLIVLNIFFAHPSEFPQADKRLEQTLKQHPNTIIASHFDQDSSTLMLPVFAQSTSVGLVQLLPDRWGKVQRIPLLHQTPKHQAQPGIMLQALRKLQPDQAAALEKTYRQKPLCIDFHGGKAYPQIPFYLTRQNPQTFTSVMGKTPKQIFANKIVIVGATAEALQDFYPTPAGTRAGVEILAHYLDTLLDLN